MALPELLLLLGLLLLLLWGVHWLSSGLGGTLPLPAYCQRAILLVDSDLHEQ